MRTPTLIFIALFSDLFISPTCASPILHKHRLINPSTATKPILPRGAEVITLNSRDLLDDLDDLKLPDFPDFPPGFPFDDLPETPFDDVAAPGPTPPPPEKAPGPVQGAVNPPAGDCMPPVTITQVEVQISTETSTITITNSGLLDGLFEGKQEYITFVVTTTETEFAPGQTVTVTAAGAQADDKDLEPTITITVTEKPEPATITITEVQTITAASDTVDNGGNENIPPPPDPPAPPAPPTPPPPPAPPTVGEPTPPVAEEPAPPVEGGQDEGEEDSGHPDFVDLGVLELDGNKLQPTVVIVSATPSHSEFYSATIDSTATPRSIGSESLLSTSSPIAALIYSSSYDPSSEPSAGVGKIAIATLTSTATVVITSTRSFTHVRPTALELPAIEFDE